MPLPGANVPPLPNVKFATVPLPVSVPPADGRCAADRAGVVGYAGGVGETPAQRSRIVGHAAVGQETRHRRAGAVVEGAGIRPLPVQVRLLVMVPVLEATLPVQVPLLVMAPVLVATLAI